ncbi:MAG: hypothetical protein WCK82_10815 [Bacteroidota bacterium]|jgi:hypothetical protein
MKKIDLQELNENIITRVKSNQNFHISKKDTFYVYSDELVNKIEGVTEEENQLSNHLLSIIGTSKTDDEDILIVSTPVNLYNILINLQRIILSNRSDKTPFSS